MESASELVNTLGPNVVYIVLLIGMWAAITAVYVPGTGGPEAGALLGLTIGGVGLAFLPVSIVGVVFLVIALGCFLALIYYRRLWPLIIAGMVFQILGSIFLLRVGSRPSVWVILIMNASALAFHEIILRPGLRIQGMAHRMGLDTLLGEVGEVVGPIDPTGTIRIHGELWTAAAKSPIEPGQAVRIVGRDGLRLLVEPVEILESPGGKTTS
jgi:membrane-bound serine protease (ClpP class)